MRLIKFTLLVAILVLADVGCATTTSTADPLHEAIESARMSGEYKTTREGVRVFCPPDWRRWTEKELPEYPDNMVCRHDEPDGSFRYWEMNISNGYQGEEIVVRRAKKGRVIARAKCGPNPDVCYCADGPPDQVAVKRECCPGYDPKAEEGCGAK